MNLRSLKTRFYSLFINPIIFITVFSVLFGLILFRIYDNARVEQVRHVKVFSENVASRIEFKLHGNLDYLNLLVDERAEGVLTVETFNSRIDDYLKVHPEFINITWVDADFVIQTVAPIAGNSVVIGLSIEMPEPKKASRMAKLTEKPIYTNPFEAIQSTSSFEIWVPVFVGSEFVGLFAGVYSCDNLLNSCLEIDSTNNSRISLLDSNSTVISSFPKTYDKTDNVSHIKDLEVSNLHLKLKFETIDSQAFSWVSLLLLSSTVLFILGFAFSLFKIRVENRLRNLTQEELEKTDKFLKKQNIEYALLNEQYLAQNKSLQKAKEKAEESDKLKSSFLANMSHEIRTPMNGILGFAKLLKEPNLNDENQQKYIKIIERSGLRMLNVINDIVDISKIEAGLMILNMKSSAINQQVEFICNFFRPEIESKGLVLNCQSVFPKEELLITTDREKVFSILTNLVKNAIKYSHKGEIQIGYTVKDNEIEFYVKDDGIGIPEHRQKAVFERFIQADIEDRMAMQGAGLGLSISKAYVEMLGGRIWLESEEGVGSSFYFTLPYDADKETGSVSDTFDFSPVAVDNVKRLKILIAEDDETSQKLISLIVEDFGNEILIANTGKEAVDICRSNPDINLILMDIQMPYMNGYEATRRIRQFNKEVIIIAQTAFALSGDHKKSIQAGCNDYTTKPIIKEDLLAIIAKHFKNKA